MNRMFKYNTEKVAKESAREKELLYGISVFGGGWYVGTKAELVKIGVLAQRPREQNEQA